MSRDINVSGGGIGLGGLLTCIFVTLKLIGTIAWSWWWVLAPVWMPLALALVFLVIAAVYVLVLK